MEAFLKECKRQGRIPRYAEFLNVDANGDYAYREGYHKLLVDFKMFDKDGNILPQGNITPNLNESFMQELLNAEIDRKQNYEFPQKVYDAIDKKFGEQYSSQETDVDTDADSAYDGVERDPVYALHQPGRDVVEIDHTLWAKKRMEAKQAFGLDDVESDGVDNYVAGKAYEWNAILRGDTSYERTEFIDFWIEQTINGLSKFPQFAGRTYRNLTFANKESLNLFLAKHQTGMDVEVDYFASTSKDPNGYVVSGNYIAHMVIDGFDGRDISDSYAIPGQQEVIYLPGTKLRITAAKTANDGHILIYAQEVNENGKDMETNYGGNRQSASGANNKRQAGDAVGKRNDIRRVRNNRGMEGSSEDRNAKVQRSGTSFRHGQVKGESYSTQETDNISNRHLLANAFEGISQNSKEYEMIQDYKGHIKVLNEMEEKLSGLNAEIRKIRFGTEGRRDTARLSKLH